MLETLSGESLQKFKMTDYGVGVRERKDSERTDFNHWVKLELFPETQGGQGVHGCTG